MSYFGLGLPVIQTETTTTVTEYVYSGGSPIFLEHVPIIDPSAVSFDIILEIEEIEKEIGSSFKITLVPEVVIPKKTPRVFPIELIPEPTIDVVEIEPIKPIIIKKDFSIELEEIPTIDTFKEPEQELFIEIKEYKLDLQEDAIQEDAFDILLFELEPETNEIVEDNTIHRELCFDIALEPDFIEQEVEIQPLENKINITLELEIDNKEIEQEIEENTFDIIMEEYEKIEQPIITINNAFNILLIDKLTFV